MINVTFINNTDENQQYVVGASVSTLGPGKNTEVQVQPTERFGFTKIQGKENLASVLLAEFSNGSVNIYATPEGVG